MDTVSFGSSLSLNGQNHGDVALAASIGVARMRMDGVILLLKVGESC